MYERILVPVDGSMLAEAIFAQAMPLLNREGAETILVRVVERTLLEGTPIDHERHLVQASKYLGYLQEELAKKGVACRWRVETGPAAKTILKVAREEGASIIAMSTHGRTGLPRAIFGSVAEAVIRTSPIPVLSLRSFQDPEPLHLRTILVPVDERGLYRGILPQVMELAKMFGARVLLLHVFPTSGMPQRMPVGAHSLRVAARLFTKQGVQTQTLLEQGDPAVVIADVAHFYEADLIAMATHGRKGVPRLFLGSVTEQVLRTSTVPMLVIRPPKAKGRIRPLAPSAAEKG